MYTNIIVSTDGSELAQIGVEHAIELARALKAKLTIVIATEPLAATMAMTQFPADGMSVSPAWIPTEAEMENYDQAENDYANHALATATKLAGECGIPCEVVHAIGSPADAIVSTAAARGCDLIVMASHGHTGIEKLLLGSQTSDVLAHTRIPVLVVKAPAAPA